MHKEYAIGIPNLELIVRTPDCEQRRFPFPEVFLEGGIQLHVVGIIEKKIELNVRIAGPGYERGVKCVTYRRNAN